MWPDWLAERGILPDQRVYVGGLVLEPAGPVVQQGKLVIYKVTEESLQRVWESYGPPGRRGGRRARAVPLLPFESGEEGHAVNSLDEVLGLVDSSDEQSSGATEPFDGPEEDEIEIHG